MKTKKCSMCHDDLPATDEFFASRFDRSTPQLQSACRKCQKEYRKKHYELNKDKYINKAKIYKIEFSKWFEDLKKELKCAKCGENRFWVLDFHHKDPLLKEDNVSLLAQNQNKKAVLKEIEKCEVLCSNCHRDLHYQERQVVDIK